MKQKISTKKYIYINFVCLVVIIIGYTIYANNNHFGMTISDNSIILSGPDEMESYSIMIEDIKNIYYIEDFDIGEPVEGVASRKNAYGVFRNNVYGEYVLCASNKINGYVVVETDNAVYVFNHESVDVTKQLPKAISSYQEVLD